MKRVTSKGEPRRVLWLIEQRDVGITHLFGDDEVTLANDHVGMCYAVGNAKNGGDHLIHVDDVLQRDDVSTE